MSRTYRRKNYPDFWWTEEEWDELKNCGGFGMANSFEAEKAKFHTDCYDSATPPKWIRRDWHKRERAHRRENINKEIKAIDRGHVVFESKNVADVWDWY